MDKPVKPCIFVFGRSLSELKSAGVAAILQANDPPVLFWSGTRLVRIRIIETGAAIIAAANMPYLRLRLSQVADFFAGREHPVPCPPPMNLVRCLLRIEPQELPLPTIRGVVEMPAGSEPLGYDPETQVLYTRKH